MAEECLRVGAGRDVDVPSLGVRDHEQVSLRGVRRHLAQRRPPGGPEPLEARHLGFDRHALLARGVKQQPAVCGDGPGGAFGRPTPGPTRPARPARKLQRPGQAGGVPIQTENDLGSPTCDAIGEPVAEAAAVRLAGGGPGRTRARSAPG